MSQVTQTGTSGEPAEAGRERMRWQTPLRAPAHPSASGACGVRSARSVRTLPAVPDGFLEPLHVGRRVQPKGTLHTLRASSAMTVPWRGDLLRLCPQCPRCLRCNDGEYQAAP